MTSHEELLSAYLDGEVTADERTLLETELARSAELRVEFAELQATRTLVRSLPPVAPRSPLALPQPEHGPGRGRRLAIAVVGVAALWLLILSIGVGVGRLPVVPDVEQLSAQHASADPGQGFAVMDADSMEDPAIMSDIGGGMTRESVFMRDDVVQVRYSDGEHDVSVFHQPGDVDWDNMPSMGKVDMMADGPMWSAQIDGRTIVVTERGDLVVTVVADDGMDDAMAMHASAMVPEVERGESLWSKIRSAPGNLWDRL